MVTGSPGVGAKFSGQAALTARLMLYSLLAIVLMAMDHRGQYVPRLRSMASYLVEPVYHVVDWPVQALRTVFSFLQSTRALLRENEELQEQLLGQQGELQRLATLREENERLRALLDGAGAVRHEFQFAELIAVDLDPFAHKVVIDRGRDQGVDTAQAVIDGQGVMGQVEDVQSHFATVRLISDPNHALPVQINRTGLRTVMFGTGDTARLNLPSVPREADVREGDLVVTSGLGDRFPRGYPVAEITRIDRREGQMFAAVEARPLASLDRGREVLLVRTPEPTVSDTAVFEFDSASTQDPFVASDADADADADADTNADANAGSTGGLDEAAAATAPEEDESADPEGSVRGEEPAESPAVEPAASGDAGQAPESGAAAGEPDAAAAEDRL